MSSIFVNRSDKSYWLKKSEIVCKKCNTSNARLNFFFSQHMIEFEKNCTICDEIGVNNVKLD